MNTTHYLNVSFLPDTGVESAGLQVVKKNARFYGVNLLSELDTAGEYFIDEKALQLYFMPLGDGAVSTKPATISVNHSAVVSLATGERNAASTPFCLMLVPSLSWQIIALMIAYEKLKRRRGRRCIFFEFSLCLSRACLGKMIVYIYKWTLLHRRDEARAAGEPNGGLRSRPWD
jgi:hypothetical protein